MKILITVSSYSPQKNGVQEITQFYAESLHNFGHDVLVITESVPGAPDSEDINGVKVIRVNVHTKKSIYYGDIDNYINGIIELSRNIDIMINVCMQTALTDCLLAHLDKMKCGKILYFHGMAHFNFPKIERVDLHDKLSWMLNVSRWKMFYKVNCRNLEKYDSIIHLHEKDKTYTMCSTLKKPINYVLENSCKDSFSPQNINNKRKNNSAYIMIANYLHDKNQEMAIKAYFSSNSKRPLVFIGSYETDYLLHLKRMAKKYQAKDKEKKVIFIVGEKHSETMNRLSSAFCLIHSSKSEKYPVVICEAQKSKTPFICTNTGICGFLPGGINVTKRAELTKAINMLESDTIIWNKLSNEAFAYSEQNQSMDKNLLKLEGIIERSVTNIVLS